jgi:hypothetical protein
VVGEAQVPARRKNGARGKMGKKSHARVENPPYESAGTKIPPLRGGSLALWCHRRVGVLRTRGNTPASVIGPAAGRKTLTPGWRVVQNKANSRRCQPCGPGVWRFGAIGVWVCRAHLGAGRARPAMPLAARKR